MVYLDPKLPKEIILRNPQEGSFFRVQAGFRELCRCDPIWRGDMPQDRVQQDVVCIFFFVFQGLP